MSRRDRPNTNRVRRRLVLVAAGLASAAGLTSCAGDSGAAADATVLEVNLGRFVIEPSVVEAPAGDLELRVTNVDPDMVHDLVVHGKGTRRLAPGESQTLEIPDVDTGEYRMWCDVQGHANAGQVGTLVVNAPAGQVAPSSQVETAVRASSSHRSDRDVCVAAAFLELVQLDDREAHREAFDERPVVEVDDEAAVLEHAVAVSDPAAEVRVTDLRAGSAGAAGQVDKAITGAKVEHVT